MVARQFNMNIILLSAGKRSTVSQLNLKGYKNENWHWHVCRQIRAQNRLKDVQVNWQTDRQTNKKTETSTDKYTSRQKTVRWIDKQTYREIKIQGNRQTDRQKSRNTLNKYTNRQKTER